MQQKFGTNSLTLKLLRFIELLVLFTKWILFHFTKKTSDSVACLVGKTAIVTGGNSGIGCATATLLASRGCRVIIADKANSEETKSKIIENTGNTNIICEYLDLSSLQSVRDFAQKIKATEKKIDVLINNAGIGNSLEKCSKDGLNTLMQINFFGSFLLTHVLLDQLKASGSARVVFTGSCLAATHNLNLENLNITDYDINLHTTIMLYSNSKLCNIIAAQGFARRLQKYGITVNSVDPGTSRTPIYKLDYIPGYCLTKIGMEFLLLYGTNMKKNTILYGIEGMNSIVGHLEVIYELFENRRSYEGAICDDMDEFMAAQSSFHVASSEKLQNETGQHYFRCQPFIKPWICSDEELCDKIWNVSEKLVKLNPKECIS